MIDESHNFRNDKGDYLDKETRYQTLMRKVLPSDFLELLDAVTIARSRKHIERFYDTSAVGKFPAHLPAQSEQCPISTDPNAVKIKELNDALIARSFCVYTPTMYILPSRKQHYDDLTATRPTSKRCCRASRPFPKNVRNMSHAETQSRRVVLDRIYRIYKIMGELITEILIIL